MKPFSILFHENGDPIDCRCINRFLSAFPRAYWKVAREIIKKTEGSLDEKVFEFNVGKLLPSFKMTRAGAFQGIKIGDGRLIGDKFQAVHSCWKSIEEELGNLKEYVSERARTSDTRSRVLVELSPESEEHVIEATSRIFESLEGLRVKNKRGGYSRVGHVAASKILFSALPEIALPVDTSEWKHVFQTKIYGEVLQTMTKEIKEWEKMSNGKKLDELDEQPITTLPAIYNVLAMAARPRAIILKHLDETK